MFDCLHQLCLHLFFLGPLLFNKVLAGRNTTSQTVANREQNVQEMYPIRIVLPLTVDNDTRLGVRPGKMGVVVAIGDGIQVGSGGGCIRETLIK